MCISGSAWSLLCLAQLSLMDCLSCLSEACERKGTFLFIPFCSFLFINVWVISPLCKYFVARSFCFQSLWKFQSGKYFSKRLNFHDVLQDQITLYSLICCTGQDLIYLSFLYNYQYQAALTYIMAPNNCGQVFLQLEERTIITRFLISTTVML